MDNIIEVIPYGHENALTRSEIMSLTGENDRTIRDAINKSKVLIINLQDGRGYFKPLPEEADLVEAWIRLFKARIKDENRRIRVARRWANGA